VSTREELAANLRALGLWAGDAALVRADVGAVGRVRGGVGEGLIGALRDAVGADGTLVALSFTKNFPLFRLDEGYVFDRDTPPTTGALARLFLEQPDAVRSRHPTNSFVAIGRRAAELMAGHDESASCFEPMGKLLALRGKQLLIGCVDSSPGFTTVHWAQHVLGLSRRSLLKGLFGVRYRKDGELRLFRRRDFGGCSRGFGKLYPDYESAGVLRSGSVGRADSLLIDANEAYRIEHERLSRDPRSVFCDDPLCAFCRGSWWYNKRDMPLFYPRFVLELVLRRRRPLE
jgi:aminoglycoside N3'-acetyltransferase